MLQRTTTVSAVFSLLFPLTNIVIHVQRPSFWVAFVYLGPDFPFREGFSMVSTIH
jgi:hypothetical protein